MVCILWPASYTVSGHEILNYAQQLACLRRLKKKVTSSAIVDADFIDQNVQIITVILWTNGDRAQEEKEEEEEGSRDGQ